jgi:hypothetical protein
VAVECNDIGQHLEHPATAAGVAPSSVKRAARAAAAVSSRRSTPAVRFSAPGSPPPAPHGYADRRRDRRGCVSALRSRGARSERIRLRHFRSRPPTESAPARAPDLDPQAAPNPAPVAASAPRTASASRGVDLCPHCPRYRMFRLKRCQYRIVPTEHASTRGAVSSSLFVIRSQESLVF